MHVGSGIFERREELILSTTTRGGRGGRERVMLTRDADEKIDIIVERVVERLVPELEAMIDAALTLLAKRAPPPA